MAQPGSAHLNIAPGARIRVRSEEWLVRTYEPSADGGELIVCTGISDLVRGVEAHFLTQIEGRDRIQVLDPALTELTADGSPRFLTSMLYIESLRLRSAPNDDRIRLAQQAVMTSKPYQFEPTRIALKQPRPRMLIADAVGLGKTLEAGILATELIHRGRGKRILVVTLKSMLTQFQKEWWVRFSIPLVRLDSVGLARVRDRIPANHNPFNYYDRTIISMDTLKNNLEYRNYLEKAYWDLIVIDECHHVAMRARDQGSSQRARLARLLSQRADALILLSATPHDGSAKSFASLIHLLDRTVIPDPEDYTPEDFVDRGLVIRRFKKDILDEVMEDFRDRTTESLSAPASVEEEQAYAALLEIPFTQAGKAAVGLGCALQRVGMQKALFSSPAAAIESTRARLKRLPAGPHASTAQEEERKALDRFLTTLERIGPDAFSKYRLLVDTLTLGAHRWSPHVSDRLVIFSERIETLNWLQSRLAEDLGLKPNQIALLHGGLPDTEQQDLVDRFGRKADSVRILLCSDVASEGLNLHYYCHRIVHFDMPWSLMTYLQRNGRIDRFGQKEDPIILYLKTEARNESIRGDQRILEVLRKKDEQAYKNLGDPLAFLRQYDVEKEEEIVADTMAHGDSDAEFEQFLDSLFAGAGDGEPDPMQAALAGSTGSSAGVGAAEPVLGAGSVSLFSSHYDFAKAAMELLSPDGKAIQWNSGDASRTLQITPPEELKARLRQIPREAQQAQYVLCAFPERVLAAMEDARQAKSEEDTWPKIQYLWPQHPIFEWLADRVIAEYRGHRAPVVRCPALRSDEMAFLIAGTIPNRKGQPMVVDWQAVIAGPSGGFRLEPFDAFVARTGLKAGVLPNSEKPVPAQLQSALPDAVKRMREHMVEAQKAFAARMSASFEKTRSDLNGLRQRQLELLDADTSGVGQPEQIRAARIAARRAEIEAEFRAYEGWVRDTMETEPEPFLQVIAAVCGGGMA